MRFWDSDRRAELIESAHTYEENIQNGIFVKYLSGETILDIGYKGGKSAIPILPNAIGIDLYYPGYEERANQDILLPQDRELFLFVRCVYETLENLSQNIPPIHRLPERKDSNKKLISIFPMAGNLLRQYPIDLWAELIRPLQDTTQYKIRLAIPYEGAQVLEALRERLGERLNKIEVHMSDSISDLTQVIKKSSLIVSNNSGPAWVASSLGVPCVAIFSGNVSRPHWTASNIITISRDVACAPCYLSKVEDCPYALKCLSEIDPREVFHAIQSAQISLSLE